MNPFAYSRPADTGAALSALAALSGGRFIAGGTNLIDLMKEDVMRPSGLVDVNRLPLADIITTPDGGLLLGALARNAHTAWNDAVLQHYPLLSHAILAGASPQIRNMASNGGNLLQRTRCVYFYDRGVPCNKREPGSGCPAATGLARQHAILGGNPDCIAVHPSDMCVALAALDAQVQVLGPRGARTIAFADFHRLPGDLPELETTLGDDELITGIALPPNRLQARSAYLKIRERASYAFALVSVAAALELDADGHIADARIALGGVAHKPWRDHSVEAMLVGHIPDEKLFGEAAVHLLRDARAWGDVASSNQFKIPLARRAVVRALSTALAGTPPIIGQEVSA